MLTVTCHVEGCENEGVAIEIPSTSINPVTEEVIPVVRVQCGPCGQQITDIDQPLHEGPDSSEVPE